MIARKRGVRAGTTSWGYPDGPDSCPGCQEARPRLDPGVLRELALPKAVERRPDGRRAGNDAPV